MTKKPTEPPTGDPNTPFGAQPGRSRTLLVFLAGLYLCWFLVLIWMAVFKVGD